MLCLALEPGTEEAEESGPWEEGVLETALVLTHSEPMSEIPTPLQTPTADLEPPDWQKWLSP